jgi:hypothetical protein
VRVVILAGLVSQFIDVLGNTTAESWLMATGLLVRLRPESAESYPHVPPGVWLAAHRREGDAGVVWLDTMPSGADAEPLPLREQHLEIRGQIQGE